MSMSRMFLARVCSAAALVGLLAGCGDKRSAGKAAVEARTAQVKRPAALSQAAEEIKGGKPSEARERLEPWLAAHPDSPYAAEAHYLLGQALFGSRDYGAAKKNHDRAIDRTQDRVLKALAMLGRADCNFQMKNYRLASRQYHWLEQMYRDETAVSHEEVLFKLGLSTKFAGFPETADYWFNKVIELYSTGAYAAEARRQHTRLGPARLGEPTYYTLEVASFTDEERALKQAEAYRKKGYRDVCVKRFRALGTSYYGVHIGKFDNKNSAMRAKEDAEMAGLKVAIRPGLINIPK